MLATYRLYVLDTRDRSIIDVIEIGYWGSDELAACRASALSDKKPAELWDRARKVRAYEFHAAS